MSRLSEDRLKRYSSITVEEEEKKLSDDEIAKFVLCGGDINDLTGEYVHDFFYIDVFHMIEQL